MPAWSKACLAPVFAIALFAQAPSTGPRFEVATIRVATLADMRFGLITGGAPRVRSDASNFEIRGASLWTLIRRAYRLELYQEVTGPDWIRGSSYDVFAKLPEGASKDQVPEMLQALLADQLKLVLHREKRDKPVCLLTVAKGGLKLKDVSSDFKPEPVTAHSDGRTTVARSKGRDCYLTYSRLNGTVILEAPKITLSDLATVLGREVNMPVFDRTGLTGFYDVSLFVPATWLRTAAPKGERADPADAMEPEGVNIFSSIQRLGLKLEKTKMPVEHVVVDSAERKPVEQ
jgi:uncharacterized protein (TIGR03435 family)